MYLILSMKGISHFTLAALGTSGVVDLLGFAFGLFYGGLFYDNMAHFLTTFSLVALAIELYLQRATRPGNPGNPSKVLWAVLTGAGLALAGGAAWEGFESLLNLAFPETIYNPPLDSVTDTLFGIVGGAFGAGITVDRARRRTHPAPTKKA